MVVFLAPGLAAGFFLAPEDGLEAAPVAGFFPAAAAGFFAAGFSSASSSRLPTPAATGLAGFLRTTASRAPCLSALALMLAYLGSVSFQKASMGVATKMEE